MITTAAELSLSTFMRNQIAASPTISVGHARVKMSRLLPVHTLSGTEAARGDLFESPPLHGWWAFVHDGEKSLGIAEVVLSAHAMTFAGIRTGELVKFAVETLRQAEAMTAEETVNAWILRVPSVFFTGLVLERQSGRVLLPILPSFEKGLESMIRDAAVRRLRKSESLRTVSRRRRPRTSS